MVSSSFSVDKLFIEPITCLCHWIISVVEPRKNAPFSGAEWFPCITKYSISQTTINEINQIVDDEECL